MAEPQYTTLKRNLLTGELEFPLVLVTGSEAVRHRIHSRFKFFRGEWFLDTRKGAPFYEKLLRKNINESLLRYLLRKILADIPGVLTIVSFNVTIDSKLRRAEMTFEAKLSDGATFRNQPEEFIVVLP